MRATTTTMLSIVLIILISTKPSLSTDCAVTFDALERPQTLKKNFFSIASTISAGRLTLGMNVTGGHDGWFGFGFGERESGHMKGADIVTCSVTDGEASCQDRHVPWGPYDPATDAASNLYPELDTRDDWTVESAYSVDGSTIVIVSRDLVTGDTQDRDVVEGPMRIIYAWGTGSAVSYHAANRGSSAYTFLGDKPTIPTNDGHWDLTFDSYVVPTDRTTYACRSFTLDSSIDRHIIAIEPLLSDDPAEHPHHALLHICTDNSFFRRYSSASECPSPHGEADSECTTLAYAWAIGGSAIVLPEDTGVLVDSSVNSAHHMILEIHYDNPGSVSGRIDSSGVRLYYTETLRSHDSSVVAIGDPLVRLSGPLIPGLSAVRTQAACPGSCTSRMDGPLEVFAIFMHMHAYGRKLIVTQFGEDGTDKGVVSRVDYWDAAFQQTVPVELTVQPGDTLHNHCYFDTSGTSASVDFGVGSNDEMCMSFIFVKQRRFVTSGLLGLCGLIDAGTICGSVSGLFINWYIFGGQKLESTSYFQDPLEFGDSNVVGPASTSKAICTFNTTGLFPSPYTTTHAIRVANVDYDAVTSESTLQAAIETAFIADVAAVLSIASTQVAINSITRGSIVVDFTASHPDASAATVADVALSSSTASPLTSFSALVAAIPPSALEDPTAGVSMTVTGGDGGDGGGGGGGTPVWAIAVAVGGAVCVGVLGATVIILSKKADRAPNPKTTTPVHPLPSKEVDMEEAGEVDGASVL